MMNLVMFSCLVWVLGCMLVVMNCLVDIMLFRVLCRVLWCCLKVVLIILVKCVWLLMLIEVGLCGISCIMVELIFGGGWNVFGGIMNSEVIW